MSQLASNLDERAVIAARLLAVDAIENAKSGHPGAALSLAPVANTLFQNHIRHDPKDPEWIGRDRFILSCGHASMLLYSQLYLTGYDLGIEDLKSFRTLNSRTPGHPEFGWTPGVDATTGPLGQGLAMAVGTAMAFAHQRALYDPQTPAGESPFDRHVWVLASDGDLQEGVSYEAGALAGRQKLDNLTVVYDDNEIQIEGSTSLSWDENTRQRFEAQGWAVETVYRAADGDIDTDALNQALRTDSRDGRPLLVILKSEIAFPAPNARGTAASHGAPLGADEVTGLRKVMEADHTPFHVDEDVLEYTRRAVKRGAEEHRAWDEKMTAWADANPDAAAAWENALERKLPENLADLLPKFQVGEEMATRAASGKTIQAIAAVLPELMGGSADLAEPNQTSIIGGGSFLPEGGRAGRNIHWGVREMGMAAAMNGISLARGTRVFGGTFLVFSDYERPAVRLAALMQVPTIFVWTHDSIALGQDGPTHQPIEHLPSLRAMPGLTTIRPADPNETSAAWLVALEQNGPTGLVLCRQPLKTLDLPSSEVVEGVRRGAYVVSDDPDAEVVVIATGSELELALSAADLVRKRDVAVRVVSMPSVELFNTQDQVYKDQVLPPSITARVSVEAASTFGWRELIGDRGVAVGIDEFGASGPAADVQEHFGMTVEGVAAAINEALQLNS